MDLIHWIVTTASLACAAGVALTAFGFRRLSVAKATYDAALRENQKQRDTIDRLLARHFERMTGDDAKLFEEQLGKRVKQKPAE